MNEITAPIVLFMTIVMPANLPDVTHKLSMPTIEECFVQALEWDTYGLKSGMAPKGAVAIRSSCQLKLSSFNGS
jgi:hypothetical protein